MGYLLVGLRWFVELQWGSRDLMSRFPPHPGDFLAIWYLEDFFIMDDIKRDIADSV